MQSTQQINASTRPLLPASPQTEQTKQVEQASTTLLSKAYSALQHYVANPIFSYFSIPIPDDMRAPSTDNKSNTLWSSLSSLVWSPPLSDEIKALNELLLEPPHSEPNTQTYAELKETCDHLLETVKTLKGELAAEGRTEEALNHIESLIQQYRNASNITHPSASHDAEQSPIAPPEMAQAIATLKGRLAHVVTIKSLETAPTAHQQLIVSNFQKVMRNQLEKAEKADQALSQIQQARCPTFNSPYFQDWNKFSDFTALLPEIRLIAQASPESFEAKSPSAQLKALLHRLDSDGGFSPTGDTSNTGAVTRLLNTLNNPSFKGLLYSYSDFPSAILEGITPLEQFMQEESNELSLKEIKDLHLYLDFLKKEVTYSIPTKRSLSTLLTKPLSKAEQEVLLNDIDAISKRLTACHTLQKLHAALGTQSLAEALPRIYELRPYLSSNDGLANIFGPVSEQQHALHHWHSQMASSAHEANAESGPDCTLQWLQATIHEVTTQQAIEQCNKANRQMSTLKALEKANGQIIFHGLGNDDDNADPIQPAEHWNLNFSSSEGCPLNLTEQSEQPPYMPPLSLKDIDASKGLVETAEGVMPLSEAIIWGYVDHPPFEDAEQAPALSRIEQGKEALASWGMPIAAAAATVAGATLAYQQGDYIDSSFNYLKDKAVELVNSPTQLATAASTVSAALGVTLGYHFGLHEAKQAMVNAQYAEEDNGQYMISAKLSSNPIIHFNFKERWDADVRRHMHKALKDPERPAEKHPLINSFLRQIDAMEPSLSQHHRLLFKKYLDSCNLQNAFDLILRCKLPRQEKAILAKIATLTAEHHCTQLISKRIARAHNEHRPLSQTDKEMIRMWLQQLIAAYRHVNELTKAEPSKADLKRQQQNEAIEKVLNATEKELIQSDRIITGFINHT